MKAVSKNLSHIQAGTVTDTDEAWKDAGKRYESEEQIPEAIELYESVLKKRPMDAYVYDRLMILYRKNKKYTKELSLINTAIKKFTDRFASTGKKNQSKKINSLSKSILLSVGLADRKGTPLYQPQPISRWLKRKQTLNKKIHPKK